MSGVRSACKQRRESITGAAILRRYAKSGSQALAGMSVAASVAAVAAPSNMSSTSAFNASGAMKAAAMAYFTLRLHSIQNLSPRMSLARSPSATATSSQNSEHDSRSGIARRRRPWRRRGAGSKRATLKCSTNFWALPPDHPCSARATQVLPIRNTNSHKRTHFLLKKCSANRLSYIDIEITRLTYVSRTGIHTCTPVAERVIDDVV